MKNYFKDKSKTDPRFTLAVGKFITYNQHRTNDYSSMYTQCGREHLKLHWKKEISFQGSQLTCGYISYK